VLGFITIIKALLQQDFQTIDQRPSLWGKPGNILAGRGDDKAKMIVIETQRLILRHFHIVDAEAMERIFCDPEVMRDYWGQGFATEAACAVRDYGFYTRRRGGGVRDDRYGLRGRTEDAADVAGHGGGTPCR
jgi:hypothetical protein